MKHFNALCALILVPALAIGQAITDDGLNVGIGIETPSHRLDVGGNINIQWGGRLFINSRPVISTFGTGNTFIGDLSGNAITSGYNNAFIGYKSGEINTTGHSNAFIGFKAGERNISGFSNAFIGQQAGSANVSGKTNVMIGRRAGFTSATGDDNVFIGHLAGQSSNGGSSNTYIGSGADGLASLTNATAIGANATVSQDSSVILGDRAKVGIGTSTPGYDLDVVGDINFTGELYQNGAPFSGGEGVTGPTGPAGTNGAIGPMGPTGPAGTIASGTLSQTLYHDGADWAASSAMVSDGTNIQANGILKIGSASEGELEASAGNLFVEATSGHLRLQTNGSNKNVSVQNDPGAIAYATFHGANENLLLGTTGNYGNTRLRVVADGLYAGIFSADSLDANTSVIKAEFTGSGNENVSAIYAAADPADGYGYGIDAIGGNTGVKGYADGGTGTNPAYGGNFTADGSGGNRIGVRGAATGTGTTNYGVFGHASGATNDWAGYFSGGNVFVNNNLGIGESSPAYPISMTTTADRGFLLDHNGYAGQAHAINIDLDASDSNFQMGIQNTVNASGTNAIARPYNASANTDNGTATAYGGRFFAGGTSSGAKYGIYALTGGSGTQYAGYFDGDTYSTGSYLGSDRKLKKDIEPIEKAGEIVDALQARTYEFRTDEFRSMALQQGQRFGFVADELKKVLPQFVKTTTQPAEEIINDDGNIELVGDPVEFEAINYVELIPILTAALQETRAESEAKDDRIEKLESQMKAVLERLNSFDTDLQQCCFDHEENSGSNVIIQSVSEESASESPILEQNQPNPFRENTVIKYYLPSTASSAQLQISDLNGSILKSFQLQGKGYGQVLITGGSFKSGTYIYTLIINGEKVAGKRMVLL